MAAIFISYRREDCAAHAGRLYDALTARFGERNVFMDVDTIDLGTDFVARIEQAIGQCDVVLALIGDDWLTVKDRAGQRRIDRPEDFVRLEIAHALAREDVRVIPVFVEGAEMPAAAELPDELSALTRRNGVSLSDAKWRSDTSVLIRAIDRVVGVTDGAARPADQRAERLGAPPGTRPWSIAALCGAAFVWFVFNGLRLRQRTLFIAGLVYACAFVWLLVETGGWLTTFAEQGWRDWVVDDLAVLLLAWLVLAATSAIHYFAIRPRYDATARG